MSAPDWQAAPPVDASAALDVDAYAMAVSMRSLIRWGASSAGRNAQKHLGASEVGHHCDRRLAYRLAEQDPMNAADPIRALAGTGFHHEMGELFARLNGGTKRWLIEQPIRYRDIPGTLDLYDRVEQTVYDWKTTTSAKLKTLMHSGPQPSYVTQINIYAAALEAEGFPVTTVALVFVPIDGKLSGLWVWRAPYDRAVADLAIDRVERLRGADPRRTAPNPDALCAWCPFYCKSATDPAVACNATV